MEVQKIKAKYYLSLLIVICLSGYSPVTYAQKRTVNKNTVRKTPTSNELLQQAEDYYNGTNGFFMNREKAKELFKQAADKGNIQAQKWMFAILNETNAEDPEAIKYLRMAAEQKDPDAMGQLGLCYERGDGGLPKDNEQALYWYNIAAENNSARALRMLGLIYYNGKCNVAVDKVKAVNYIKRAADLGDGMACGLISSNYSSGDGVDKNEGLAVLYAKKGADLGDELSLFYYGTYLEDGFGGLQKDEPLAFSYYKRAAEQGDKYSMFRIAEFYLRGRGGVTQSKDKAKEFYVKAYEAGYGKAAIEIADYLCNDKQERLSWYEKAADKGDITGQAEIAWAHCTGDIANNDTKAGAKELMQLSKTGNPRALYYCAELLRQGVCGIPKDKKSAKAIFESLKNSDDDKASFYASCSLSLMK